MLDDVVVPVDDPDVAVGADLGRDRRGPLVVAGEQVPALYAAKSLPLRSSVNVATRCPVGSATNAVRFQYWLGIGPGGVEGVAGRGGEAAVLVDLADLVGDREELSSSRRCSRARRGDQPRTAS